MLTLVNAHRQDKQGITLEFIQTKTVLVLKNLLTIVFH